MTAEAKSPPLVKPRRRHLRRLAIILLVYLLILLVSRVWHAQDRTKSSLLFGKVTKMSFAVESWAIINEKHKGDPISPPDAWLAYYHGIRESVAGEVMEPPQLVGDPCGVRLTRRLLHFPANTRFLGTKADYQVQLPGSAPQPAQTATRSLPYCQRPALPFLPFAWMFLEGS